MNGIELTRLLKKDFPDLKVIAISMHGENQIIKEMLDAGISGYILKNTGKQELIEAITKVASGGTYFDERMSPEKSLTASAVKTMKLPQGNRRNHTPD